jgi:hypothetical protein
MYHTSEKALDQSPRPRRRGRTCSTILWAGTVSIPVVVLVLLGVAGGGLFQANQTLTNLYRRTSRECHPQMLDQFWRLEIDELKDLCDQFEDLYGLTSALAGPSPYQCKHTYGEDYSPIPQFRVLGERHSGTNGASTRASTDA